jgi:predicted RND superfamily exporter protein
MAKWFSIGFWEVVARIILRNRIFILSIILLFTVFRAMQWKNMRFSHTEANLLPDDHEVNQEYNAFLDKFGDEGNLIKIGRAHV